MPFTVFAALAVVVLCIFRVLGVLAITLMVQVLVRLEDISVVVALYPHQLPRARELDISLQGPDTIHSLVLLDVPQSPLGICRLVLLLEQCNRVVDVGQSNLPQFRTDLLHLFSPSLVDWELRSGELPYQLAPAIIRRKAFAMPRCTEELNLRGLSPRWRSILGRKSRGRSKEAEEQGSRFLFFCEE